MRHRGQGAQGSPVKGTPCGHQVELKGRLGDAPGRAGETPHRERKRKGDGGTAEMHQEPNLTHVKMHRRKKKKQPQNIQQEKPGGKEEVKCRHKKKKEKSPGTKGRRKADKVIKIWQRYSISTDKREEKRRLGRKENRRRQQVPSLRRVIYTPLGLRVVVGRSRRRDHPTHAHNTARRRSRHGEGWGRVHLCGVVVVDRPARLVCHGSRLRGLLGRCWRDGHDVRDLLSRWHERWRSSSRSNGGAVRWIFGARDGVEHRPRRVGSGRVKPVRLLEPVRLERLCMDRTLRDM